MLVIAQHSISDPDKFWSAAQALGDSMPSHLKLHSVIPSVDMKSGTCLWEGPSVDAIQTFIDNSVGDVSKNVCYEVNQAAAMGLPQAAMAAVQN
ncbi:MAG: hypothetical protein V4556_12575 [Bacteroidota bacterium]